MTERVKELGEILVRDFGELPIRIRFVFEDLSGSYDEISEWYDVKDGKSIKKIRSIAKKIYGYHLKTASGKIFDFWFNSDENEYNLVGLEIGPNKIDIEAGKVVYKSDIVRLF